MRITRELQVVADTRFHVRVHDIGRYAADLDHSIVLNEYGVTRQVAMHDRWLTFMQIAFYLNELVN